MDTKRDTRSKHAQSLSLALVAALWFAGLGFVVFIGNHLIGAPHMPAWNLRELVRGILISAALGISIGSVGYLYSMSRHKSQKE